jgi:hypothetical protein
MMFGGAVMDGRYEAGCGFLLPAALETMRAGLVYYSPDGGPVLCLGDDVPPEYMKLPGRVAYELNKTGKPQRRVIDAEDGSGAYVVTYAIARDHGGNPHGYLMTRQRADGFPSGARADGDGAPAVSGRAAVTPDTGMAELFSAYPLLWKDRGKLDEELSGLGDPMALEMLRQATVGELARSLGADTGRLISKINELARGYAADGAADGAGVATGEADAASTTGGATGAADTAGTASEAGGATGAAGAASTADAANGAGEG